ncbi:hypothetical protein NK918_24910, partial [Salmonella enterica subsp. enterica serovar Typhimurium]|nr:hypothetical protein [Salmonella enterica subsp. enterica serovar Typhimurium]
EPVAVGHIRQQGEREVAGAGDVERFGHGLFLGGDGAMLPARRPAGSAENRLCERCYEVAVSTYDAKRYCDLPARLASYIA